MAKDSLFVDQEQPAKASVVLKLKANRPLRRPRSRGIAGLVSASVESLRPESVIILDTFGRPLTRPAETTTTRAASGLQLERQQQIERDLSTQGRRAARAGGRRRAACASTSPRILKRRHRRRDRRAVGSDGRRPQPPDVHRRPAASAQPRGGVAGARANQPPALSTATPPAAARATPPPAPLPRPAAPTHGRRADARRAVPGRTHVGDHQLRSRQGDAPHRQSAGPARAAVGGGHPRRRARDDARRGRRGADDARKPWEAGGMQRIQGLVAAAVGLDTERGDQLTVENIAFETPPDDAASRRRLGSARRSWTSARQHWPSALRVRRRSCCIALLRAVRRPSAARAARDGAGRGAGAAGAGGRGRAAADRARDGRADRRRARRHGVGRGPSACPC